MAVRSGRRLRRMAHVPDSESDDDGSLPNVQPIHLSDDEDNATSPPRVHVPQQAPGPRHPVEVVLNSRGVRPRTDWLESCLNELTITHPGFAGMPAASQAELCFGQFLMADFNVAGAASLPPAMHSLHGTELPGPFVLQVDEVIDISHSLRDRYQEKRAGSGRTLKLSITDGVQRVSGLEYRPIGALQVLSPAGMKISLKNVCVKRGLLMLVPEVLEILGGSVEHLESARLRAVQVINKPPRGRRTRQGEVEPSLAATATRAAWSANAESSVASVENNHRPQQRTSQEAPNNARGTRPSNTMNDHPTREVQQEAERRSMQFDQPLQPSGQSAPVSHLHHPTRASSVHQGETTRTTQQQDQPAQGGRQSVQVPQFQHSVRSASVQQGTQRQPPLQQDRVTSAREQPPMQQDRVTSAREQPPMQQDRVTSTREQPPMQQDRVTRAREQSVGVSGSHSVGLEIRQQAGHLQQPVERLEEVHLNGNFHVSGVHSSTVGRVHHQLDEHHVVQPGVRGAESRTETMTTNVVRDSTSIQPSAESSGRPRSTPTFGRLSSTRRLVQTKIVTKPPPRVAEHPVQPSDATDVTTTPMDLDESRDATRGGQNAPTARSNPVSRDDASRERVPFTYLSVLKDRINSQVPQIGAVRGRVKCVITGVISFQFKDVDEFTLNVHIEDGSLITAALVQHQMVQRLVGCSPRELDSGLKDPHTHKQMFDNMVRFQKLLERYEGLMEVEFLDASSVPLVLQMTEGLEYSDVKLLCERVHRSRSVQTPNTNNNLIPTIDLSTP